MNNSDRGKSILEEFKFFSFLGKIYTILTTLSPLFPLSNQLFKFIPLAQKIDTPTYEYVSTDLVTFVATVITLYIIWSTFTRRHEFEVETERKTIRRKANISFAIGILALLIYLGLFYDIYTIFYAPLRINSGEPGRLIGDFALMLSYSAISGYITKGFMLLGMEEYFKPKINR